MRDLTLDKTLLAKTSFERFASNGGVTINSYQANNGQFADAGFQQAIKDANQTITFCAVGAHHQNGIVERCIKELMLISCTLLLHVKHHWPDYITAMMWPFALKEASYRLNWLSLQSDGHSCEATFFGIDKDSSMSHHHTFLDHPALFWIRDFNQVLEAHQNGSQDLVLVFMLDTHQLMQDWLLWYSIHGLVMYRRNTTWYLMTSLPLCLLCRKKKYHQTGPI
jgi:hypothetical protein